MQSFVVIFFLSFALISVHGRSIAKLKLRKSSGQRAALCFAFFMSL
jgi:hypothetical protein